MEWLVEHHPLLCPDGHDAYSGFISVDNRDVLVRITRPIGGTWADAGVEVEPALAEAIPSSYVSGLGGRVRRSNGESVRGVVQELVESVRGALGIDLGASSHKRVGEDDATAIAMHALLVEELDTLGWESVVAVDLDRVAVTLTATDARGVAHHVEVLLPSTYPSTAPLVHTALPLPFALAWPPPGGERRGGLLGAVLDQFSNELERHQAVWRELDVFDERCWILEPTHPTPRDVARRVVVGSNTSVHVTLDPAYPRHLPECRFLGPDHAVGPLRSRYGQRASLWDPSKSALDNLEFILDVHCLPPTAAATEEFAVECGICYTYDLDGIIPERVCEDQRCARAFHSGCLYEYVRGLPNVRQSFGTIFGSCPYCNTPLTVKLQQ